MTNKEKIDYNIRCAKFLGYCNSVIDTEFHFITNNKKNIPSFMPKMLELNFENRFYSDWNWIMTLVEFIEEKSSYIIMGVKIRGNFKISNYNIQFYFNPNNKYLLHLELKTYLLDNIKHCVYKEHIVEVFDFRNKGKKEAVVHAINTFLIWYETYNK